MKIEKITRVNGWLNIVEGECVSLEFSHKHIPSEAASLYSEYIEMQNREKANYITLDLKTGKATYKLVE